MAMELVEEISVGSGGAASIEFTSIPQTGVDLLLVYSNRSSDSTNYLSFNGDASSGNYSSIYLEGQGGSGYGPFTSSLSSENEQTLRDAQRTTTTANTFSNVQIYVSNYTTSSAKSYSIDYVTENNAATAFEYLYAGRYAGTSPITSVKIRLNQQEFSIFSLYIIS